MGLGILYNDLSLVATFTGTATAGDGALTNLQDPQPRTRARFDATGAFIILDLLSVRSIDIAGLVSTNQVAASSILLRMSAVNSSVTGSLTYDSGFASSLTQPGWNGNLWRVLPAPVSARYIRWDIVAPSAPIDIGLAPCGLLWRPLGARAYGHERAHADGGVRDVNPRTGAHFTLDGARARAWQFVIPAVRTSEIEGDVLTLDQDYGLARDVAYVPNVDATAAELARDCIWGAWKPSGVAGTQRTSHPFGSRAFSLLERL